jgi:hypothetical protein
MPFEDAITAMTPVVTELERLSVPYYVGGSVASSAYGHMRTTQDADLIADLKAEHVAPLVQALGTDYYISATAALEAIGRRSSFNLIHYATMFKVDLFAAKLRPYDRMALTRIRKKALDREHPDSEFFVASPEDVVLSKLEWFRLGDEVSDKQWIDITKVLNVQQNTVDRAYLSHWAAELRVADLLERAWKEVPTDDPDAT